MLKRKKEQKMGLMKKILSANSFSEWQVANREAKIQAYLSKAKTGIFCLEKDQVARQSIEMFLEAYANLYFDIHNAAPKHFIIFLVANCTKSVDYNTSIWRESNAPDGRTCQCGFNTEANVESPNALPFIIADLSITDNKNPLPQIQANLALLSYAASSFNIMEPSTNQGLEAKFDHAVRTLDPIESTDTIDSLERKASHISKKLEMEINHPEMRQFIDSPDYVKSVSAPANAFAYEFSSKEDAQNFNLSELKHVAFEHTKTIDPTSQSRIKGYLFATHIGLVLSKSRAASEKGQWNDFIRRCSLFILINHVEDQLMKFDLETDSSKLKLPVVSIETLDIPEAGKVLLKQYLKVEFQINFRNGQIPGKLFMHLIMDMFRQLSRKESKEYSLDSPLLAYVREEDIHDFPAITKLGIKGKILSEMFRWKGILLSFKAAAAEAAAANAGPPDVD